MPGPLDGWAREAYGVTALLGIPFHRVTMQDTLATCERLLEDRSEPSYIVTANVDFTYLASRNPALRDFIFHSDLVICDGLPLVGLSKVCGGGELPERVAGSDLGMPLLELCAERGFSVYFLGSDEATLGQLEKVLAERLPGLRVAGHCSPPIGPVEEWDDAELSERIEKAAPHLVLAAFGCPKQEQWIARNHRSLGVPLCIGVGATSRLHRRQAAARAESWRRGCAWSGSGACAATRSASSERYATRLRLPGERPGLRQWRDSRRRGKRGGWDRSSQESAGRHGYTADAMGAWRSLAVWRVVRQLAERARRHAGGLLGRYPFRRRGARAALRDGAAGAARQRLVVRDCRAEQRS